jgi:hypothetical protein
MRMMLFEVIAEFLQVGSGSGRPANEHS